MNEELANAYKLIATLAQAMEKLSGNISLQNAVIERQEQRISFLEQTNGLHETSTHSCH